MCFIKLLIQIAFLLARYGLTRDAADAGPKPHTAGFSRLRREKPARALHRRARYGLWNPIKFGQLINGHLLEQTTRACLTLWRKKSKKRLEGARRAAQEISESGMLKSLSHAFSLWPLSAMSVVLRRANFNLVLRTLTTSPYSSPFLLA